MSTCRKMDSSQFTDLRYKLIRKIRKRFPPRDARSVINKKIARRCAAVNRHKKFLDNGQVCLLYTEDIKSDSEHIYQETNEHFELNDLTESQEYHESPRRNFYQITINNLSYTVTNNDIYDLFRRFGNILEVNVVVPGRAVVVFDKHAEAVAACKEYNMRKLDNRVMKLSLAMI